MARKAGWQKWGELDWKTRENYAYMAESNKQIRQEFLKMSRSLQYAANYRLKLLEKHELDYGATYNNAVYYTQTMLNRNRFGSLTAVGSFDELLVQNDIAYKFLTSAKSDWRIAEESERYRINTLIEHEVLPQDFSIPNTKDFLKFISNEEATATIDEYGTSDLIVDIIYGEYNKKGRDGLRVVQIALNEYLSGSKTLMEALSDRGVQVGEYLTRARERAKSMQNIKNMVN